ncbi:MAG: catalase [Mycoplasmatales bacterium]
MKKTLTTAQGNPVLNDNQSISTGEKEGYVVMQDVYLMEKLAHFNRERIPERVVHAKGSGAYGEFTVTNDDLKKYTRADFLSEKGKKTKVFLRFSTVGGEKGSSDSARDPRGFALKFYTEKGNYDLVGNNTPIFFIRDAMKFPDLIHTQKRDPQTNLKDADMFWDFFSLTPESIHQVTILFSDRGIPKSYRHMNGYSSHTYMWYNEENEYVWIKLHFKTNQKIENLTQEEADILSGTDPDHATRDLYNAIANNLFPSWTVYVQIMTQEQAKEYEFDPFDITKVWYQKDFPLMEIGHLELNENPENFFAETEQVALSPSNFVDGIGPSPDKLLQGRLFAYADAQRYRLGANHSQIPVNKPKNDVQTTQRDGSMAINNGSNNPNYTPNSTEINQPSEGFTPPAIEVQAVLDRHIRPIEDADFIQAGKLYEEVLSEEEKTRLTNNIASHLKDAKLHIQLRQTALFYKASSDYGTRVAKLLDLDVDQIKQLALMTQEERINATK